jgi:hypothetical protein
MVLKYFRCKKIVAKILPIFDSNYCCYKGAKKEQWISRKTTIFSAETWPKSPKIMFITLTPARTDSLSDDADLSDSDTASVSSMAKDDKGEGSRSWVRMPLPPVFDIYVPGSVL